MIADEPGGHPGRVKAKGGSRKAGELDGGGMPFNGHKNPQGWLPPSRPDGQ